MDRRQPTRLTSRPTPYSSVGFLSLNIVVPLNQFRSLSWSTPSPRPIASRNLFSILNAAAEYRHLPKYVPGGVFVRPASDDAWHGVIFIRQGVYKEGLSVWR